VPAENALYSGNLDANWEKTLARAYPVLRALRSGGIEVAAIHSHMLDEQPRLFFLHFWANDDASKLAHGLRAALDKTSRATATVGQQ